MGITLNKQQKNIVEEAKRFIRNDSEQVFQYSGYAATGKSTVLDAILSEISIPRHRVAAMAYSGQASNVLRSKGMMNAKTIHSWLYKPVEEYIIDSLGNIVMDNYLNRPKYSLGFEPKPIENIDLFLIDEAGSVPIEFKEEIESRGKKIIATGDLGQLPPVHGEPAYLYTGKVLNLTEIMLQGKNSSIVFLADRARKGLPIHQGFYGDVLVISEEDLTDQMIMNSDIILCAKNSTRDYFNNKIRQDILGIQMDIPVRGERVVCRKNNWNVEVDGINLTNGLIGEVLNNPGIDGFDGKTFKMDFKPFMCNGYFPQVSANYNYLVAPYAQRKYLKNDKYNRSECFEFAYAITTHMAQGGRFGNGIYFEEFLNRDIQNNLNYTGITRFSNSLIYVKKKKKYY